MSEVASLLGVVSLVTLMQTLDGRGAEVDATDVVLGRVGGEEEEER